MSSLPIEGVPARRNTFISANRSFLYRLVLLLLLAAEILGLSIFFDTEVLQGIPSVWAELIGRAPQYLRLAIAVSLMVGLFNRTEFWNAFREHSQTVRDEIKISYLIVHLLALALFTKASLALMGGGFASLTTPGLWTIVWFASGAATITSWCLLLLPLPAWQRALRQGRVHVLMGVVTGLLVFASGFITQEFWKPLAGYTFASVRWMLSWIYSDIVVDPAKLIVGTRKFKVIISPECSGYEGMGLIVAFMSGYLWLSRKSFRFPLALLLLPLGAAAAWILNAVRIFALVVIGSSGWPAIARGGFHSQAGWIAFSLIGLGLVAITQRGRYFMTDQQTLPASSIQDEATAYLAPFLTIVACAMLTGALSAGFDWLYPIRVIAAGVVLWKFRNSYKDLNWSWSWTAIGTGVLVFGIWLALFPADLSVKTGLPVNLQSIPWYWSGLWLLVRIVGYVVTVPLAEELAFRSFLVRRLKETQLHPALAILISSVLFGALHGRLWLAGTIAGILFALCMNRRKSLGDAVQAHATTNALLAIYVFSTGRWGFWS